MPGMAVQVRMLISVVVMRMGVVNMIRSQIIWPATGDPGNPIRKNDPNGRGQDDDQSLHHSYFIGQNQPVQPLRRRITWD